MSTKYRNPASVAQERVMELSSQWNHSLQANSDESKSGSNENMSSDKSTAPEWTDQSATDSTDVNAKVWSQQIHGPGANKNNLKPSGQAEKSSQSGHQSDDASTTHPSNMGSDSSKSSKEQLDDKPTSNNKPRGPTGKEMPGKGLGNSGHGPEKYAREEDDSLPAEDTGTPHKDNEKRSDE